MAIEIRVPTLGESITEATVGKWYKKVGDLVAIDEPIVELETDKVSIEVPSPVNGIMSELTILQGTDVKVGTLIGRITKEEEQETAKPILPLEKKSPSPLIHTTASISPKPAHKADDILSLMKKQSSAAFVTPTKKLPHRIQTVPAPKLVNASTNQSTVTAFTPQLKDSSLPSPLDESHRERREPMSRLRRTIANRLQEVQQNTAMLTTFNEVDLLNIMTLRQTYKDAFFKKHDIKLGIMSFFIKALIHALKDYPTLNAEIDNNEMVYKDYYHIGVAVGTDKGLVVPVIRDADQMRFDEIERSIVTLAKKARSGDLQIEELQGGTFSLTNGGIYGSLMSTPILNAPQSGILGMHKIQDRPIALDGQVVIRPMMYIALTYDHRIIDGKDAVSFLVRIKESLENPERLFLDL